MKFLLLRHSFQCIHENRDRLPSFVVNSNKDPTDNFGGGMCSTLSFTPVEELHDITHIHSKIFILHDLACNGRGAGGIYRSLNFL